MNAPELCPALLYDRAEERVICFRAESVPGAWGFVCLSCWEAMLDGKARREEWEVEDRGPLS
jgi:hypothetical protein